MHVVLLTPFYPPMVSGAAEYVADVAEGLVKAGHRVTVVMGQGEAGLRWHRGIRVDTVRSKIRGATSAMMAMRAVQIHLRDSVDLVVSGTAQPTGFVAATVAAAIRRPLVVVALGEDVSVGHTSRFARACLWMTFRRSRHVMAASDFTMREVLAFGGSLERCSIVHPGIDVDRFLENRGAPRAETRRRLGLDGRHVVLTVARLEERKGHDIVLDAIHRVLFDHPDVHYLIVGYGDDKRLRDMADKWGINDRLTIVPHMSEDELTDAFAAADVFAMTSRPGPRGEVEGFGIVYLEAAATGLPCIAGSLGGCSDAVVDGVTGWCVDPLDPAAVAAALNSILDDSDKARRMGQSGRQRVCESFTKSALQCRIVEILENAADGGTVGRSLVKRRC